MTKRLELKRGQKFGRWHYLRDDDERSKTSARYVICKCSCKSRTVRSVRLADLRNGASLSCGCLHSEAVALRNAEAPPAITHGLTTMRSDEANHRLLGIHSGMLRRCYDESCKDYKNYGAAGVTVTNRWRTGTRYSSGKDRTSNVGFVNFLNDMKSSYFDKACLDKDLYSGRKKTYSPETCVWMLIEDNNKLRSRVVDAKKSIAKLRKKYPRTGDTDAKGHCRN